MLTELEAINAMVQSTGHSGFTSAQNTHPLYRGAETKLSAVSSAVHGMALYFNTRIKELQPQSDGTVYVPQHTLSIDPICPTLNLAKRGARMYDLDNDTYNIGAAHYYKILEKLDWPDIPFVAQEYIMRRAVYEYFLDFGGADPKLSHYRAARDEAYERLHIEHISWRRTNIYAGPGNGVNRLRRGYPSRGRFYVPKLGEI